MSKFERVKDPADPCRCQAVGGTGQCPFKAVEGAKNCARHHGGAVFKKIEKQQARLYMADRWAARIQSQTDSPRAKSLGEELGIMRMLLEEKLKQCTDESELMYASSSISEMANNVRGLVESATKLDEKLGQVLDKNQVQALARDIVTLITSYLDDADVLEAFSEELDVVVQKYLPEVK